MSPTFASDLIDGRYRVGDVIGQGGVAEVRSGVDTRLQRAVAIKLLRHGASDQTVRERFECEARAAASISDPHVVSVYDSGEHEGALYIVMELLPGGTLADEIAKGPLAERRARVVLDQVLQALCASHACGVLHRDIKPDNILVTATGDVRVADFGIAKVIEDVERTVAGSVLGTPSYLSPEGVRGEPATEASDVYGAGVVLYEALAGAKPFTADTPASALHAIAFDEPIPLRQVRPDVDERLLAVVERAMAKNPADRFPSAASMKRALAALDEPAIAPEVTTQLVTAGRLTRPIEPTMVAPASAAPVQTHRQRPRVPVQFVVVVAVLLLVGAALMFSSHSGSAPATASTGAVAPTTAPAPPTPPTSTIPPPLAGALDQLDTAVNR